MVRTHRRWLPSHSVVALLAVAALALSCKPELPTEEWARMQLGRRASEVDALDQDLTAALKSYVAGAKSHEPGSRAALQQAVGRILGSARWVTSWRPPTLMPSAGAEPIPLDAPITVPPVEQGGPERLEPKQIAPGLELYWGLYRLGSDSFGGIELAKTVRSGDASLRVHLIVVPNKAQLSAP